jgi:GTP-binding protein
VSAFILIDIRHSPLKIDLEFIIWLATNKIPFSIIFTKTDKISKIEIDNKLLNYKKELEKNWEILPEFFISSSEKYTGKEDILNYIDKINQSII